MDKIEQAREVSSRIWNAGYVDESATIDALIEELAALKGQEPVGTVVDPTYVDMAEQLPYGTKLYLAAGAQPVPSSKYPCQLTDAELADPEYMRSYIEAMNQDYADLLYAQLVRQEPVAWEHCFVDPSKKILSYTKTCAGFPPRDDAYQINPLFLAAGAQPYAAYNEAKRLAEWLFKTHFAKDEDYASGRVVWEVWDTTAVELRRLHQMNTDLVDSLRELLDGPEIGGDQGAVIRNARALIEKATAMSKADAAYWTKC